MRFFSVIRSDAPPEDAEHETSLSCAHCLLDEHSELGEGMDLALEHGCAVRDPGTGAWSPSESGDFFFDVVLRAREQLGR